MAEVIRTIEQELREHPFLRDVPPEMLARLAELSRAVTFTPGTFILREGEEADTLYLVTKGRVVLEVHVPGHGATKVESVEGGDILGLHWLFPPRVWVLDARALGEVHALALDAGALRRLMEDDVHVGYALSSRLLAHLYERLARVRLQRLDVYRSGA